MADHKMPKPLTTEQRALLDRWNAGELVHLDGILPLLASGTAPMTPDDQKFLETIRKCVLSVTNPERPRKRARPPNG